MEIIKLYKKALESFFYLFKFSIVKTPFLNNKTVLIDLKNPPNLRRLKEFFILFSLSGYTIYYRVRFNHFVFILRLARAIRDFKNIKFIWYNLFNNIFYILLSDLEPNSQKKNIKASKEIYIRYDYSPKLELKNSHFAMPLTMHHSIYLYFYKEDEILKYRQTERKIKILFAGNVDKMYHNDVLHKLIKKNSRFEIVEYIKSKNLAEIIYSEEKFNSLLQGKYYNSFILLDNKIRINQSKWLKTISYADFFLCLPGVIFPWAHHVVEAMAVGSIPILNYPEWLIPKLENKINCLVFNSLKELEDKIKEAFEMSKEEIAILRNNVIKYYETNLCLKKFLNRLELSSEKFIYLHTLSCESLTSFIKFLRKLDI